MIGAEWPAARAAWEKGDGAVEMDETTSVAWAPEANGPSAPAARAGRRRGPRGGFKHWTPDEDRRLRDFIVGQLERLGTLQAVVQACHADFRRDEGSVMRRIRQLRRRDPELDAFIASRVARARALAEENKGRIGRAPEIAPRDASAAETEGDLEGFARPAAAQRPSRPAPALRTASASEGDALLLAQFLEENSGPIGQAHRARLAALVARHGQVAVMAALADSLLHRADVVLADVEARLQRAR